MKSPQESNTQRVAVAHQRLVRWFFRQFTDYRWARLKLGGRWQKWVPENGKNQGFWLEGVIVPDEIADILKMKGGVDHYVATPEVEIYPANDQIQQPRERQ